MRLFFLCRSGPTEKKKAPPFWEVLFLVSYLCPMRLEGALDVSNHTRTDDVLNIVEIESFGCIVIKCNFNRKTFQQGTRSQRNDEQLV